MGAVEGHSERKESLLRWAPFQFRSGSAPICEQDRQKAEIRCLDSWCEVRANRLPILLSSRRGNQQSPASAPQLGVIWRWYQIVCPLSRHVVWVTVQHRPSSKVQEDPHCSLLNTILVIQEEGGNIIVENIFKKGQRSKT